jgi:hypothetical protein
MATTPYEDAVARQRSTAQQRRPGAPLAVAATVAAGWAALTSFGLVLGLVALGAIGSGGTPAGVARLGLAVWLLGHGVALDTPTDRISLIPLALTAFAAWRVARAGVHASRAVGGHRQRGPGRAIGAAAAVAGVYALLAAGAAALAGTAEVSVSAWRAAVVTGLFGLVAATTGALVNGRAVRTMLLHVPAAVRDGGRTGLVAAALILAAGSLAAGVALAVNGGDAAGMLASYRTGVLGQAGITVLCLVYAPNLAVWGAAYLLGPGFAVGADTIVRPGEVLVGPLPALPPLAGLPSSPVAEFAPALLAAPVLAATAAGWLLARRTGAPDWPGPQASPARGGASPLLRLAGTAAIAGPVAGLLVYLAGVVSSGGLGSGRLAALGPTGWTAGLVTAVVVSAGVMLGASAARTVRVRASARRR